MVKFLGIGVTHDASEVNPRSGGVFDRSYTSELITAHEKNGWDGLIFHYNSATVDPSIVATYASTISESIQLIIAVRPNTCAPTYMAKKIATLDTITQGRVGLHVISGGYAAEQLAEGDSLDKDRRYARAGEFIEICRRSWTESAPFSYNGEFFETENFYSDVRCADPAGVTVSTAGMSDSALKLAATRADRHALWGMPLAETKTFVDELRRHCDEAGRENLPEIQMQFRPILGETTSAARKHADDIMLRMQKNLGGWAAGRTPETAGAAHALEVLKKGEWHDECFWAGPAGEVSGTGNNTALVGTPAQIADALCQYNDLGVTVFGLNDYDTLQGAIEFGRDVIPIVRKGLAG
ncbi:LLM class flavin-dependent oxidoreductase [Rhodococcus qingshengii]|uniref:LLM class flavin-dependent oxidoreductase n=1 Tax=Rhodococcus qingshengii TaxID=334542 RepID=UPI0035FB03BC